MNKRMPPLAGYFAMLAGFVQVALQGDYVLGSVLLVVGAVLVVQSYRKRRGQPGA